MDPFEKFESSPRGWLIPLALFVLGALATWTAITQVKSIAERKHDRGAVTDDPHLIPAVVSPDVQTRAE